MWTTTSPESISTQSQLDRPSTWGFLMPLSLRPLATFSAIAPVNPAGGDDHVVGICRFAAKVDGDRFFRLHIVEAGEDQIQGLVGVWLRLQVRSFGRCFTRGFGCSLLGNLG